MKIKNLKGDLFGGLITAIIALPIALAFGVQSGLGPLAGMYGAITLGFFAALLGGTPAQVSGPTGPMTVVAALFIVTLIEAKGSLIDALPLIIATFSLAGIFQVVFGVLRFGNLIKFIPYPVISGFMTGIGTIIILLQIFPMLGHRSPSKALSVLSELATPLQEINWYALGLTASALLIIYLFPKCTKKIPSSLLALIALTCLSYILDLPVPKIGTIPSELPTLQISALIQIKFSEWGLVIGPAVTLATLGAIDSLLTSVIADNLTKKRHKSNKELLGQGVGNTFSGLIGGLPGAGATMRTVANINAGGNSSLSGMCHSLILLMILLFAGPLAAEIPLAVLSGILITVGISILDYKGLMDLRKIPKTDACTILIVLLLTVFVNLLHAVIVGVVLATFFFMKKMSDLATSNTFIVPLKDFKKTLPGHIDVKLCETLDDQIFVKSIHGPLFFGFVSQFKELLSSAPKMKFMILNMANVPYIDQSGLYALEDALFYLKKKSVVPLIVKIQEQPLHMLESIRAIPQLIGHDLIFSSFDRCVQWIGEHTNVSKL